MSSNSDAFFALSIRDLLDAREAYHVHLTHLENVVATGIGRYRVRVKERGKVKSIRSEAERKVSSEEPKTLFNTIVDERSWPCVMVFVDRWVPKKEFGKHPDQIVPPRLYLPDGRVVPTCVLLSQSEPVPPEAPTDLDFPSNRLGGGDPVASPVQGEIHTGTVACLVTDGDALYALTNRHVTGPEGRTILAKIGDDFTEIGTSDPTSARKIAFPDAYPGFPGERTFVNLDAGLIRVDDISLWTTQVLGIGKLGRLVDLNVDTLSLDLIGLPVRAYGSASGMLIGEVQSLFYRYRSVGGFDYVADLLIGPRPGHPEQLPTRRGDSGALWVVDEPVDPGANKSSVPAITGTPRTYRPLAVQWGGHVRTDANSGQQFRYALATCLSTVCRVLDVDVVPDFNNDLPEFWGALGHYTIGALASALPSSTKLKTLMDKNKNRVSFDESKILADDVDTAPGSFFPLSDVPDTVWKTGSFKRSRENPTHFADMDEKGSGPFAGQDLFFISQDETKIVPAVWNAFYETIDVENRHKGSLPFRVWQIYAEMVTAVKAKNVTRFVAAAGILAHYVGDACQPLHASRLHDGDANIAGSSGVHSAYETKMIARNRVELFNAVKAKLSTFTATATVVGGHKAAVAIVDLMRRSKANLPPMTIIDSYVSNNHRIADMWTDLKDETIAVIADGCKTLANLWQSAWTEGNGESVPQSKIKAVRFSDLENLYQNADFLKSVYLDAMAADTALFHL